MKKMIALLATLLIAGAANANTQTLLSNPAGSTISTNSDSLLTYTPAKALTGGVLVDYTFSFTGSLQTNDFLGFWFGTSTGPSFGLKANCGTGNPCTDDVFARVGGTDGTFLSGSNLTAGTDYHLMGYLHKTGNSTTYNAFDVWLNPTAAEMASLTGADIHTGATSIASISSMGFRSANIDNGVTLTVRDINVSAVPEPGTVALMGLAAAGMGFLRRRKNG